MHWKRRFSRRISRRCCGDFTSTSPSTTASASWIGFVTKSSSGEERCVGAASDTGCSGATSGAAHGLNCRTRRLHIRQSEEAETRQRSGEPGRGNLHAGFWGGRARKEHVRGRPLPTIRTGGTPRWDISHRQNSSGGHHSDRK